ncbi:AI-2E family transporter [Winogradskyella thalassocola]|uniref:Predicted PurR-regulated permease PerM n=1 Tax=Winogradskyella thalassocola TaxID=262004 RepID=A0A1G8JJ06_9FLAO|nr:AI-2E family transporter [Winogradskyella thalassocola]SDI30620.1 Predicted PurR-regulated permease PerM [Winogradskyella thalassocola]
MTHIEPKIIRQIFVLLLIIFTGSLIFYEILPYLTGVLGAITFYILLKSIMKKLVFHYCWKPALAAATLMIGSFFVILIPLIGFGLLLGEKISDIARNSEKVINALKDLMGNLETEIGIDINSQIDTQSVTTFLTERIQNMAGSTFNLFIAISIMYFMLYFMLISFKKLRQAFTDFIPMSSKNIDEISGEVQSMVKSNAIGIPLVALAQGFIALIGFVIFGIEDALFWFAITTIGSLIPFVGISIGIVPVFLLALSYGNSFQAWGILTYGTVVVGATDNLLRLYILKKLDDVHPLITLFGVLVGIPLFGFIGVIFGPLLVSVFLGLIKIYKAEYGKLSEYSTDDV